MAAHRDAALHRVVKPRDQLHKGGLGRTGASDDPHGLSGVNVEIHMGEGVFLSAPVIFKRYVFECDPAVGHFLERTFGRLQGDLFLQNLPDPSRAGKRPGKHEKYIGDHHQRVHDLEHIA